MSSLKHTERAANILLASAAQLMPAFANMVASVIVVRLIAPQLWGQIAVLQLYLFMAVQLCAWGNKDFLLRQFSIQPANLKRNWMDSFGSRAFLLIPAMGFAFLPGADMFTTTLLCLWIVMRFIQQAFEVSILYNRNFTLAIASEILSMLIIVCGLVWIKNSASLHGIVVVFTLGYAAKTMVQFARYRSYFAEPVKWMPGIAHMRSTLPFMLLGFTGILLQKADFMCFTWYANDYDKAQYQVFNSFLNLIQAVPGFIVGPYLKNLYRVKAQTRAKVSWQFAISGMLVTLLFTFLTFVAVKYIYKFELPPVVYLFEYLYGALTYFYIPQLYMLFKYGMQNEVLKVSMIAIVINIISCVVLIPLLNIPGAMLANIIAQFVSYILFRYSYKKTTLYAKAESPEHS